jgi:sulfonate transport system substrate-binding protein
MKAIRTISVLFLLSILSFQLTSCDGKTGDNLTSLTIGTFSKAIDYSPFFVAKHFRWFEDSPDLKAFSIQYTEFNDRPAISTSFDSGGLQALFAAEPPVIICRAQDNDIRIVEDSCTLQQEIVVRTDLPIYSVADLRGRRVAVLQGTSSHYGLLKILRSANLGPNDIELRFMGPDQAKVAFETKQIDGWAVWPPFVEQQQVNGKGRVLTGGDAVIQSVMAIPESLIAKHQVIAKALVDVIQESKKWIIDHPDEAQSIVANQLGIDIQVVKTAWGKHKWDAHLTEDVISDIQQKAQFLATDPTTRLRKEIDVRKDLIDARFSNK